MGQIEDRIAALAQVPGRVEVKVTTYKRGDPLYSIQQPDGTVLEAGATVSEWRTRFGGDETIWKDPIFGQPHVVSLAPYAHFDDSVMLSIGFMFKPLEPIAEQHRHLFPALTPELRARAR